MKRIVFNIFFFLLIVNSSVFSQFEEMSCLVTSGPEDPPTLGYILPSTGTVNVLIVFAQFSDDNYDTTDPVWEKGEAPSGISGWIDETWTSSPTQGSLTHYFNDMSYNDFKFIGETVSVTAPHSRQWYLSNNKDRWDIHKEILQLLDSTWDFEEFDNWDADKDNNADGKVDMIIFVWRNIAREYPSSPTDSVTIVQNALNFGNNYGSLGFESNPNYFEVDGGLRKIYANDWGSGVTIKDYVAVGHNETFRVVVHEIAHYLLGGNKYHSGFGFWGMLSSWGYRSIVANSFERSLLGWISPQTISSSPTQTVSDIELDDYIANGDAVTLVIDSSNEEYFYVENHQVTSYWESTFAAGDIDAGVYVIRKVGAPTQADPSWLQLIAADGRFNWEVNQSVDNPWGPGYLPVFNQLTPNKNSGYHDCQYIPFSYGGLDSPQPIHFTEVNGSPTLDVRFKGDGKDAFGIDYNEVFSPWSNPNSYRAASSSTPFGFELTNFSSGVYTFNVHVNTASSASPSTPQNLQVSDHHDHPSLSWDANTEPDIAGYYIYRQENSLGWEQIDYVSHPTTVYMDYDVDTQNPSDNYYYKLKAKDSSNNLSTFSLMVEIEGLMPKIGNGEERANDIDLPTEFSLNQNYPNPFNPTTTINYTLPVDANVTLKIYDIVGREIKSYSVGSKSAGVYSITWDGTNENGEPVSSGTYVYRFTALTPGGINPLYSKSGKMVLLK